MIRPAMRLLKFRRSNRRFLWLLWLALLTPIAQTVAAAHVLSHSQPAATGDSGKQLHQEALCGLCVAAASVSTAAPPGAAYVIPTLSNLHEAIRADPDQVALAVIARAYESRAPPFLLH